MKALERNEARNGRARVPLISRRHRHLVAVEALEGVPLTK